MFSASLPLTQEATINATPRTVIDPAWVKVAKAEEVPAPLIAPSQDFGSESV